MSKILKVGILTLFSYTNYGNRLQNYAVQEILKSLNCEVYTLHMIYLEKLYSPHIYYKPLYKKLLKCILPSIFIDFLNVFGLSNGFKAFLLALKNRKWSNKYIHDKKFVAISYKQYNKKLSNYDHFIVGSDQVWNPNWLRRKFWLDFAPKEKRLALSASIGLDNIPDEMREVYFNGVQGMEHISVREHSAVDLIRQISGREAMCFFDPTMLVYDNPNESWRKLAIPPKKSLPEKYVFCYFLGDCCKINKLFDLPVIYLSTHKCDNCFNVGEFLYSIIHATYVFTDSFHGTVFSTLFHKQFITFQLMKKYGESMMTRIKSLLEDLHLSDRIWDINNLNGDLTSIPEITPEQWQLADEIIKDNRERFFKWLKEALNVQ